MNLNVSENIFEKEKKKKKNENKNEKHRVSFRLYCNCYYIKHKKEKVHSAKSDN